MPRPPSPYRTIRACETCGTEFAFTASPSQVALGRGRFCSKPCRARWQSIPLAERFRTYLGSPNERGCVIWTGATNGRGYGVIGSGGYRKPILVASRVAWELAHGPITEGLCVLHRCDNPLCVNVEHLFLGTKGDNTQDMLAKGRQRKRIPGSRRWRKEQS